MKLRFLALAALTLTGCSHVATPNTKAPTPLVSEGLPSGKLDPRVSPVQRLVEIFVVGGTNAGRKQHYTSFRFLAAPVPGLEGQHGLARGWLSDDQGRKVADFRVEFVAFDDMGELHAAKSWTYPVQGQPATRVAGPKAGLLTGQDLGVNTDPDGPAIQWATEMFLGRDVKPEATPHFTTFRLLTSPMPGGWQGQHFSANGWLSVDGQHPSDPIYVEGVFDREQAVMRMAMCYRFSKTGGAPVLKVFQP